MATEPQTPAYLIDLPKIDTAETGQTNAEQVTKSLQWLTNNAVRRVLGNGSLGDKTEADLKVGDSHDYTKSERYPLSIASVDVNGQKDDGLAGRLCTHGIIMPTNSWQQLPALEEQETIVVNHGTLKIKNRGTDDETAVTVRGGESHTFLKGREYDIKAEKGPADYTCLYGDNSDEEVLEARPFDNVNATEMRWKGNLQFGKTTTADLTDHSMKFILMDGILKACLAVRKPGHTQILECGLDKSSNISTILQNGGWNNVPVAQDEEGEALHQDDFRAVRYIFIGNGKYLVWVVHHVDNVPYDQFFVASEVPEWSFNKETERIARAHIARLKEEEENQE